MGWVEPFGTEPSDTPMPATSSPVPEGVQMIAAGALHFLPLSVAPALFFKCHNSDTAPHSVLKYHCLCAGKIRIERRTKTAIK